jgi:hypothetical protein
MLHRLAKGSEISYGKAIRWLEEEPVPDIKRSPSEYTDRPKTVDSAAQSNSKFVRNHVRERRIFAEKRRKQDTDSQRLKYAQAIMHKLQGRRTGSERKEHTADDDCFNIISNKLVNYFNITNYKPLKTFKKVNETIAKIKTKIISPSSPNKMKYTYSGMQEHQFLAYNDKISDKTSQL